MWPLVRPKNHGTHALVPTPSSPGYHLRTGLHNSANKVSLDENTSRRSKLLNTVSEWSFCERVLRGRLLICVSSSPVQRATWDRHSLDGLPKVRIMNSVYVRTQLVVVSRSRWSLECNMRQALGARLSSANCFQQSTYMPCFRDLGANKVVSISLSQAAPITG